MKNDRIMLGVFPEERYWVFDAIDKERFRQDRLWGEQSWPNGTTASGDYLADAYREACEDAIRNGYGYITWYDIFMGEVFKAMAEEDPEKLEVELVQAVAVATAWIEDIRRKRNG